MPHYKGGQEARAGDFVRMQDGTTGIVYSIYPSNTTCNASVHVAKQRLTMETNTVTLRDTELLARADDPAQTEPPSESFGQDEGPPSPELATDTQQ